MDADYTKYGAKLYARKANPSVTLDMGIPIVKEKEAVSLIIMVGAFVAACLFGINVVYIVIVCGIIGIIRTLLLNRRKMK